jgi:tRNA 5-methylaminomethyl-2-thiouridine biosynthesis bifunctional protein
MPGEAADSSPRRVAVIGAGIAGAAAGRAVRALGGAAGVLDAEGPGAGGSGNPAGLVTPRLDAGLGPPARLFAHAFARAVELYKEHTEAVVAQGVLQLAGSERDESRFARIAASDLFEPGALEMLSPEAATVRLGEPAPAALDQRTALVLEPAPVLAAWTGEVRRAHIASLSPREGEWVLLDEAGEQVLRADAVILAAAQGSAALLPDLPLRPVRGQASWTTEAAFDAAAAWGGYVLPIRGGLLFGATHDRDDAATDLRPGDHARNLETLAAALPALAQRLADARLEGRAAIRATTPDRLPIAGEAQPGLFVLTGFGSRGLSMAPLLAEHVAALALRAPSPLPAASQALVAPDRFARRASS